MPVIRSISDLRNKSNEISELCHKNGEPVFITRNGQGDLVVMSQAAYERLEARLELYRLLGEAERLDAEGEKGITHREMIGKLRSAVQT